MINRILIVGFGSIGKRHLRLARELLPKADIRILRHQKTFDIPEYSNGCLFNIKDALDYRPQIAVIASPASEHIKTAQILANAGVHILVEKPLSNSTAGIDKLIETCQKKNVIFSIGYNLRYTSSIQRFRELLLGGIIGKTLSVRCNVGQFLPAWRPDMDYRNSVSARQDLGGGVLLELSHELDYLRWIFGEVAWVKASLTRQSNLEINVEDSAHLVLGFQAQYSGHRLVGAVSMDFIRHDAVRECIAIGESGSLRWNGLLGEVSIYIAGADVWQVLFEHKQPADESYLAEWQDFISCVIEDKSPFVTGYDGKKILRIIEAARQSDVCKGKIAYVKSN